MLSTLGVRRHQQYASRWDDTDTMSRLSSARSIQRPCGSANSNSDTFDAITDNIEINANFFYSSE